MADDQSSWRPAASVEWAIREAWTFQKPHELVNEACRRLIADGIPLWRFTSNILALHPEVFGDVYVWHRQTGRTEYISAQHASQQAAPVLTGDNPLRLAAERRDMVRLRLTDDHPEFDFPLLQELRDEGGTDYAILPMEFNDGSVGLVTFATDRNGGFSEQDIAILRDFTMVVARPAENLAIRALAQRFLDIYVGHDAGRRILNGQIMRGSGDTIHAALWFCDLRGFTALSDALARETLIGLLNEFFDCMAGAVQSAGGEILKFIGDGMLAIFPVTDGRDAAAASNAALQAATDAAAAMAQFNDTRTEAGAEPLGYGITLHVGDVMYGNIGASGRLDFTVIGPAVNLVNRMQKLARERDRSLLVSAEFAAECRDPRLTSIGSHEFRGVAGGQEIFVLDVRR